MFLPQEKKKLPLKTKYIKNRMNMEEYWEIREQHKA